MMGGRAILQDNINDVKIIMWYMCKFLNADTSAVRRPPDGIWLEVSLKKSMLWVNGQTSLFSYRESPCMYLLFLLYIVFFISLSKLSTASSIRKSGHLPSMSIQPGYMYSRPVQMVVPNIILKSGMKPSLIYSLG